MSRTVNYTKQAAKELARIPTNVSRVIRGKINAYATDPASQTNMVIQLTDSTDFRMRVGDYRVIFYLTDTTMEVVKVRHRGSVYE